MVLFFAIGIEFVRSKIKELKLDENVKNKENSQQNNITIIEEHNIYSESYELYTMDKISKGILRN